MQPTKGRAWTFMALLKGERTKAVFLIMMGEFLLIEKLARVCVLCVLCVCLGEGKPRVLFLWLGVRWAQPPRAPHRFGA